MKKFLALFAAAVVMTACTKKEEAPAMEEPTAEATEETTEGVEAVEAPPSDVMEEAPAADASSSEEAK